MILSIPIFGANVKYFEIKSFFYQSVIGEGVTVGDYSMIFNSYLSNIVIPEHSLVYSDHGEVIIKRF